MRKFKDVRDGERIWVRAFTGDSSHTWAMTKEVRQIDVSIYKRDDLVVKLNGFDLDRFIVFGVSQTRAIMVRRDREGDLSRVEKKKRMRILQRRSRTHRGSGEGETQFRRTLRPDD